MKTKLVNEFKDRFDLSQEDFNKFLQEYQDKDRPLRTLCEDYKVDYNSFRYLAYQIGFKNATKAERAESVLKLNKDLAIESGADYDIEHKLEEELESVVKENLKLRKSVMTQQHNNNVLRKEIKSLVKRELTEDAEMERVETALASILNKANEKYTPIKCDLTLAQNSDLLTMYPYTDLHIAMLALEEISGYNYDLKIARKWILGSFDYLMTVAPNSETCLIAEMGDLLHANDDTKQTVSGHSLDVDSRHSRIIEETFSIMIELVKKALQKHKYVKVLSVSGNHSENSSYYLKAVLRAYFKDEPRVEIVGDNRLTQYYQFNKVLLGFSHGHTILNKTKLTECMIEDNIDIFSETKYRYWNIGHLHSNHKMLSKEDAMMSIEIHKNLPPRDAWADGAGFRGNVGEVKAITYHKKYGEVSRNLFKIDMLEVEQDKNLNKN
jgi:hypothetical protein